MLDVDAYEECKNCHEGFLSPHPEAVCCAVCKGGTSEEADKRRCSMIKFYQIRKFDDGGTSIVSGGTYEEMQEQIKLYQTPFYKGCEFIIEEATDEE